MHLQIPRIMQTLHSMGEIAHVDLSPAARKVEGAIYRTILIDAIRVVRVVDEVEGVSRPMVHPGQEKSPATRRPVKVCQYHEVAAGWGHSVDRTLCRSDANLPVTKQRTQNRSERAMSLVLLPVSRSTDHSTTIHDENRPSLVESIDVVGELRPHAL